MLIQLLIQHPSALGSIVRNTPTWVWGLLAALLVLGTSQLFHRRANLARAGLMPVAMTVFSIYGMVSAFAASPMLGTALTLWFAAALACTAVALRWRAAAPEGSRFDPVSRQFELPGSVVPMALILGIFLTKYIVGIELAMQASVARDAGFVLGVALLYGAFNGLFVARALRLWRLVARPARTGFTAV